MATRLAEGTDLNHVTNPAQIDLYLFFDRNTFKINFKILAVLLYFSVSFLHEHIS